MLVGLSDSKMVESKNIVEDYFKNLKAFCKQNKESSQACINHKCENNAFICPQNDCVCIEEHKKCIKITTESLMSNLKQKIIPVKMIEDTINKKISDLINFLSAFRVQAITQIKKQFELYGLTREEKDFLDGIKNGNLNIITGSQIKDVIYSEAADEEGLINNIGLIVSRVQDKFDEMAQNIGMVLEVIKAELKADGSKSLENFQQNVQTQINQVLEETNSELLRFTQFKSEVVIQQQEFQTLCSFFKPRTVKSMELLYRASEQYFSLYDFHQKCDGIPDTLTLVQTEFGKKIGGYTPIQWGTFHQNMSDESMSSFIFSLTQSDKFCLRSKQNAVCHNDITGPRFGKCNDLQIGDSANQVPISSADINTTYFNDKYKNGDQQSWERFCGNSENCHFKIKQWEVWRVVFN